MGQSAWDGRPESLDFRKMHTQVHVWPWPSHQRLNVGHPDGFADWLAGLVDGDGIFHFRQNQNGSLDFSFKVTQSNYNRKLLAYLKKKLGCGSITSAGKNHSQYRIRNPQMLWEFLVPLLETTQFMTDRKAYEYGQFKKALQIYMQWKKGMICREQRDKSLRALAGFKFRDSGFKASWKLELEKGECPNSKTAKLPTVGWILGFTEAEGSFYLTCKTETRMVHGAGWTQNHEPEILERMRQRWKLKAKVKLHQNGKAWLLDTTAGSAVETLIPFFEGKLKGIKAVEVRKWARSYRKHKGNFKALRALQNELRKAKKLTS
jgi:hypothetical protein